MIASRRCGNCSKRRRHRLVRLLEMRNGCVYAPVIPRPREVSRAFCLQMNMERGYFAACVPMASEALGEVGAAVASDSARVEAGADVAAARVS